MRSRTRTKTCCFRLPCVKRRRSKLLHNARWKLLVLDCSHLIVSSTEGATWFKYVCGIKHSKESGELFSEPSGFLLYLQRRLTATTSISQLTTPGRSTLPAKHHRPTAFLCGWSVGVEFFAGLLERSCCWPRYIHTTFENVYVRLY